jgi:hypothetical protein
VHPWTPEALVDRRVVPAKWQEQHRQLREAVAVLYPALPLASDELAKMRARTPGHEDVHYFDCKRVLAALAASDEGSGKNFFGQYTSPVLRQWGALVRQYEKNNVFAAEAARIIAQNTAFEVYVPPAGGRRNGSARTQVLMPVVSTARS